MLPTDLLGKEAQIVTKAAAWWKSRLPSWGVGLLTGLGLALLFFWRLGQPGLMDPDEGRYAEVAREMLVTGNYWLPQLNFVPYLEKPPLVYWLTALSLWLGGLKEWAARLVPAVSAVAGAWGIYWLGTRVAGRAVGVVAAGATATSWGYFLLGRLLTLDMPLTCCLIWSLAYLYLAWEEAERRRLPWAYLWLGLGVMTKGPVAVVLPVLIMACWLAGQRRLGQWRRLWHPPGLLLFLLLTVPWYAVISWREPGFLPFFFGREHLLRFLAAPVHGGQPVYYYVGILPLLLLPWTFLLLPSLVRVCRRPAGETQEPAAPFLLVWAGVILVFFSLASAKLPAYILPAIPPLALWLAIHLRSRWPNRGWPPGWRLGLVGWLFAGLGLLLAYVGLWLGQPHLWQQLAILRPAVELLLVALVVWPAILWLLPPRPALCLPVLLAAAVSYNLILIIGVEKLAPSRSPREVAAVVRAQARPEDILLGYQLYSQGLSFYTGRPCYLYRIRGELDYGLQQRPGTPYYLSDAAAVRQQLASRRGFILAPAAAVSALATELELPLQPLATWKKFLLLVTP